ncbi:MAG: type VI secretion system Vgr family protein [Acidiferrobacterales bacterium]
MHTTFSFHSDAVDDGALRVIGFEGEEEISRLYEFRIELISEDPALDLAEILSQPAFLGIDRKGELLKLHGILASFEQAEQGPYYTCYRAVLVPRLWLLTQRRQNQIFQDKSIDEIIGDELEDSGLTSDDYEFRLTGTYDPREYVVQYEETDFNFISRLMEHEGIFYFFEYTEAGEKLVMADGNVAFGPIPGESAIVYRTPSGLHSVEEESVQALVCRRRRVPRNVILRDYNYRNPSAELMARYPEAAEDSDGGVISEYGDHFRTSDEGKRLARIRAEQMLSQENLFFGESDCVAFRSGFCYTLEDHYRSDFDQQYLFTRVRHVGSQSAPGIDGLPGGSASDETNVAYRNEFTSIPSDVPFRPARLTPKPRLHGVMNAKVDAAGDGEHAEIDDQGRYKVVVPFDLTGTGDGKASRYIRMSQPYAGPGYGAHFPLHKGTEVLWACVGGDLDRPVITGAVPNPQTKSPVTKANRTESVIRDYGGNEISLEGTAGSQRLRLYCPKHGTEIVLGNSVKIKSGSDWHALIEGQKNDEIFGSLELKVGGDIKEFFVGYSMKHTGGWKHENIVGASTKIIGGGKVETIIGAEDKRIVGVKREITKGAVYKRHYGKEYKFPGVGKVEKAPNFLQAIKDYKASRKISMEIIEAKQIVKSKTRTIKHIKEEIDKIESLTVYADSEEHKVKENKLKVHGMYLEDCRKKVTKAQRILQKASGPIKVKGGQINLG